MAENIDCGTAGYIDVDGETFVCRSCSSICSWTFQEDPYCTAKCPDFIPFSVPEADVSTSSADVEHTTTYEGVAQNISSGNAGLIVGICALVLVVVLFVVVIALLMKVKKLSSNFALPLGTRKHMEKGEETSLDNGQQDNLPGNHLAKRSRKNLTSVKVVKEADGEQRGDVAHLADEAHLLEEVEGEEKQGQANVSPIDKEKATVSPVEYTDVRGASGQRRDKIYNRVRTALKTA